MTVVFCMYVFVHAGEGFDLVVNSLTAICIHVFTHAGEGFDLVVDLI